MNGHIRSLTQRARLYEFVASESGAMSAQNAARIGVVLGTSALAGLLMMIPNTAKADCPARCPVGNECAGGPPGWHCEWAFNTCADGGRGACDHICTFATNC